MAEASERLIPGTSTTYFDKGGNGFSKIAVLLEATGGLSLSQVCAVTGLEASTIQNWVKRGWVSHPSGKKYQEAHIARILIINALKECIKLEHIALLMDYVSGKAVGNVKTDKDDGSIGSKLESLIAQEAAGTKRKEYIKESELFNYLCKALQKSGKEDDISRLGVEAVVERIIKDYKGPTPEALIRLRKALTLMIYACVCTDVKRRTETMMGQILYDLEHPESLAAEAVSVIEEAEKKEEPATEAEVAVEIRKTVSQALREWDLNNSERPAPEQVRAEKNTGDSKSNEVSADDRDESEEKPSYRPWYFRKGPKQ